MRKTREIIIDGDIAIIPLTQSKQAIIDADMVDKVRGWNWSVAKGWRDSLYAARKTGEKNCVQKCHLLHRVITDCPEGMQVDHINGDGLDNRRSNLRIVTKGQNQMNARKRLGCLSPYKGVTRNKKRWSASCNRVHIGTYDTQEEAALVYNREAIRLFGEHALLNDVIDRSI